MNAIKFKFSLLIFGLFVMCTSMAQSTWKNWDGINLNLGLTKRLDVGVSHLRSYEISNGFQNNFNQSGLFINYDVTRRISAKSGIIVTHFPGDTVSTNRIWARGTYRLPIERLLNWSNGIQVELHSATQKQYNYRFIFQTRVAARKRLNFLSLMPSLSYWLYYNKGGNTLQYYDESGSPLVQESPDGLHRGRVTINLNSRVSKNLSLSLYYMNQHEFNLSGRNVNVVNPTTGKVSRPFKNFQVVGVSVNLSFDAYKKRGKKNQKNEN